MDPGRAAATQEHGLLAEQTHFLVEGAAESFPAARRYAKGPQVGQNMDRYDMLEFCWV